jgi:hypothetical protein
LLKRPQSRTDIAGGLLVAAVLFVCCGAPTVAPGSDLGKAMTDPWVVVCVVPWMMAIGVAVSTVVLLVLRRRSSAAN